MKIFRIYCFSRMKSCHLQQGGCNQRWIIPSEVRKRKGRYPMIPLCMWNPKYVTRTCLWSRNKLRGIENRFVVVRGRDSGGGEDGEFGISRGRLLYIDWIKTARSYYMSTGNHIPSPIKITGERNVKNNVYTHTYIYNWIAFAIQQKLTQCCKLTILQ